MSEEAANGETRSAITNSSFSIKPDKDVECDEDGSKSYHRVVTLKKRHGKCGSYHYDDGSFFIGDFDENGVRCGMGHLELPNGATYDGQFMKGLPNGVGVMRFTDSSRYEGEFMQGWFHGHGIYVTLDGTKYEGEFRGGRIWGNGLMTYRDGISATEGYFQDSRFAREGSASEDLKKARKISEYARKLYDETDYDCAEVKRDDKA